MSSSQFESSMSCPECPSVPFLPDPDHAIDCDDDDSKEEDEMWWDDHVTKFPTNYYVLLSPTDYEEIFGDDAQEISEKFIDDQEMSEEFIDSQEMSEEFIDAQEIIKEFIDVKEIPKELAATYTMYDVTWRSHAVYTATHRSYAMYVATDHAIRSYDHQHVTEESYANIPVIAFCNIAFPSLEKRLNSFQVPEKLSRMFNKKMEKRRLTHNSTSSCGLVKKQRLQGKKKGDATTGSSTNVLSPAAP